MYQHANFEVFTAVKIQVELFWVVKNSAWMYHMVHDIPICLMTLAYIVCEGTLERASMMNNPSIAVTWLKVSNDPGILKRVIMVMKHDATLLNSMVHSPSAEANDCSALEEILCLLWNLKVYYHVHSSPPMISVLSQMNSVYTSYPISLRSTLKSSNLCPGFQSCFFPSSFLIKTLYALLISHVWCMPYSFRLPWFDHLHIW